LNIAFYLFVPQFYDHIMLYRTIISKARKRMLRQRVSYVKNRELRINVSRAGSFKEY
jgi:hypothetical protein